MIADSVHWTDRHSDRLARMLMLPLLHPMINELSAGRCVGCYQKIDDQFFMAVSEMCYHCNCLRCCICQTILNNDATGCYYKNGALFCKLDYTRQFSRRCARCRNILTANDVVMRAKDLVYHVSCFTCSICHQTLSPGEQFALAEQGVLYCQNHYEPLLALASEQESKDEQEEKKNQRYMSNREQDDKAQAIVAAACLQSRESNLLEALNTENLPFRVAGNLKHLTSSSPEDEVNFNISTDFSTQSFTAYPSSQSPALSGSGGRSSSSKRMRTSFKHHQLRTMKAYFALNHNPDAKDLKQLAQRTGLTKRVLQVWFQNARAKYRRAAQNGGPGSEAFAALAGGAVLPHLYNAPPMHGIPDGMQAATMEFDATSSPRELYSRNSIDTKTEENGFPAMAQLFTNQNNFSM